MHATSTAQHIQKSTRQQAVKVQKHPAWILVWSNPAAGGVDNLTDVANIQGRYGVLTLGAALVIIVGGIDLSVGSVVGCAAVLFEGDGDALRRLCQEVAALPGPVRPVFVAAPNASRAGSEEYPLEFLLEERSISTNTAAAGGNATLMALG